MSKEIGWVFQIKKIWNLVRCDLKTRIFRCYNPLDIEVVVKETHELFQPSYNENGDGKVIPTLNSNLEGFRCENDIQEKIQLQILKTSIFEWSCPNQGFLNRQTVGWAQSHPILSYDTNFLCSSKYISKKLPRSTFWDAVLKTILFLSYSILTEKLFS